MGEYLVKFYVENPKKRKQVYDILNIFFDHDEIVFDEKASLKVLEEEIIYNNELISYDKDNLKRRLYDLLKKVTGYESPWGYLTGSKPSKLLKNLSPNEIKDKYDLSDDKLRLLVEVKKEQEEISIDPRDFSLYINIPFCPSRCHYCSYPTIVGPREDRSKYIDSLIYEIENISLPRKLDAIYIGGGTPSYIKTDDLRRLLLAINEKFSYKEFTFEAGREDTLGFDKLKLLRENGVERISLNPQSFNENIVKRAGRSYNFSHFLDIFKMARDLGFIINTDFIIGLMGEKADDFKKNFLILEDLMPDNITFHTLAIKVSSKYFEKNAKASRKDVILISKMIDDFVRRNSYKPYYLYRQKNIASNLENVGYQKNNTSQRYNIIINEELESIIGLGMNANSKLLNGKKFRNSRNLRDYYEKVTSEIDAKNKFINGYSNNN